MKTYEANAYAYDHIGNHTTASVNSDTTTYTANNLNQYTSFSNLVQSCNPVHDLDGNMLTNGVWSYTWDCENRLVTVSSNNVCAVSNAYDHAGRRVLKITPTATHAYVYDGWNLVQETIQNQQSTTTNHYVWGKDLSGALQDADGVGGLLAVQMDGSWYFPFYDNNGNVIAYVDEGGAIVADYVYDAYGGTIAKSGAMADAFAHRFSTKYYDTETGLYYYGYRFYDPAMHRWLNRDPIEEDGGLNLYAFCGNDGVNNSDCLGLWSVVFSGVDSSGRVFLKKNYDDLKAAMPKLISDCKKWAAAIDHLPDNCVYKSALKTDVKRLGDVFQKIQDGFNSTDRLLIKDSRFRFRYRGADALVPLGFRGKPRNIIEFNTNPEMAYGMRDEKMNKGVFLHELSHIAGVMNESARKGVLWSDAAHSYNQFGSSDHFTLSGMVDFYQIELKMGRACCPLRKDWFPK